MSTGKWSEKDLVNKWGRKLPDGTSWSLPWDVLDQLVSGLSGDTKLPVERLRECIRTRDVSGLFAVTESLDVTGYASSDLLLQDRLVVELFSKYDFVNTPFNKEEKAKFRFYEAEERCREANFRIKHFIGLENDVNAVIHRAQRIICRILGAFDVNEMLTFSRFGPGASIGVGGPFTTEYFKLCERCPTVSSEVFPYAEALLEFDVKWKAHLFGVHPCDVSGPFSPSDSMGTELSLVDHNKVAFVPKNAKTLRSIAIEPYFNIYFQLGVGGMIRRRLYRRAGINLDSQKRNQMLALNGSVSDSLATIDFSMASDTISVEVVRLLLALCPDWFAHLDRLRSKTYVMDGAKPSLYHKFSSMGNGFTFELETLIFYALAIASCDELGIDSKDVTVYGDDVILPNFGGCELYIRACSFLGFKVNEDKSFVSGPFRESCGEDYLRGFRVRPVFCKELQTVQHVASLANRLLELNRSVGPGSRVNDMLCNAVDLLHSRIPRDVRKLVVGPPSDDVDGYIHTDSLQTLAGSGLVKWNRRLFAWEFPTIRFVPREFRRSDASLALWVNRLASVKETPIPKMTGVNLTLRNARLASRRLSDYIDEPPLNQITGRKVGELSLGRGMFYQMPRD